MEIFIKTGGLVLTKSCRTIPLFSNQNSTQISKSKFGITIEFAKGGTQRAQSISLAILAQSWRLSGKSLTAKDVLGFETCQGSKIF